jgi:hypothetical protein
MPRADADNPWEYILPSRCYALAGRHCTCPFEDHLVATALKSASASSLRYSASRRGENRPREAAGWFAVGSASGWAQAENDALAWLPGRAPGGTALGTHGSHSR